MVGHVRGSPVNVKVVSQEEYERYCVQERGQDAGLAGWWSKSYIALKNGECEIEDGTFEDLLAGVGRAPKKFGTTLEEMMKGQQK